MIDSDLIALCVWDEARGEIPDGQAAVARVILNRMTLHYESDGTVPGTVLAHFQFSGFWFNMVGGKYTQVSFSLGEAQTRAEDLLVVAQATPQFTQCLKVSAAVFGHTYQGPLYDKLNDSTVLYFNPAISSPTWANPENFVVRIGHHDFYRTKPDSSSSVDTGLAGSINT